MGQGNETLTAYLVEDVQRAVDNKQEVSGFVSSLQRATLPGLIEYLCLQYTAKCAGIPKLPKKILESEIGNALQQVSCELSNGEAEKQNPTINDINPRVAEFFAIKQAGEVEEEGYKLFRLRFKQSATKHGFSSVKAGGIESSLHEMTENALLHADSSAATLVGYYVTDQFVQFTVADVGRGILSSLKTNPRFQSLSLSNEAIKAAIRDRNSRFASGGYGFRQVFKSLTEMWGTLRFRSGAGCLTMDGTALNHDVGTESFPPPLPGFQVTGTCRRQEPASNYPAV